MILLAVVLFVLALGAVIVAVADSWTQPSGLLGSVGNFLTLFAVLWVASLLLPPSGSLLISFLGALATTFLGARRELRASLLSTFCTMTAAFFAFHFTLSFFDLVTSTQKFSSDGDLLFEALHRSVTFRTLGRALPFWGCLAAGIIIGWVLASRKREKHRVRGRLS